MVRPALVLALFAATAVTTARASELPRHGGMYAANTNKPLPMLDSKIDISIHGPIAEAVIEQRFRNDLDRTTEATYIFPLPLDAAVTAMSIQNGKRTITAAIEKREQAHERYEAAIAAGLAAGLLDQERPDVFTQAVAAIPPKGEITVKLRFDFTVAYQAGAWELALPLVVAPRYVPGSASGKPTVGGGRAPDTDRAPDASRVTPGGEPGAGGKTRIALRFGENVDDVASPTHELSKVDTSWQLVDSRSDHDLIVRWRAHVPQTGWMEQDADGGFAAVVVEAPPPPAKRTSPLRMLLVVDRAATTRGDAELVEHPLVRALFGSLGATDRAAVTGSDRIDWGAPDLVAQKLEEAWQLHAGAFDLTQALGKVRADGAAIVLVSDGLVADDAAAVAAARKVGAPIHVIGIGPAPNRSLLAAIATTTGGTLRFAAIDADVAALARDVLADAGTPPQPISVNWGTLVASDVVPASLPRLGAGQAALVIARVKRVQQANARVRGDVFALASIDSVRPTEGATSPLGPLGRRWARMNLDELLAAGNAAAITEHALRYGLVSPYTSMVAVGTEVVVQGGVKHSVAVPVSVPEGMHWQAVEQETRVDMDGEEDAKQKFAEPVDRNLDRNLDRDHERRETKAPPYKKMPGEKQEADNRSKEPKHASPKKSGDFGKDDDSRTTVGATQPWATGTANNPTAQTPPVAPSPPPAPDSGGAAAADEEESDAPKRATTEVAAAGATEDAAETISVQSESLARGPSYRLSLAFGGGVAVERHHGTQIDGLAAITGRVDVGLRTRFGVEGSLWLVGTEPEGQLLFSVARRGIARFLELRAGLGVHLGDGFGPAANLTLRTRLPLRHLSTFLRYDGALLRHDDGSRSGQNTTSLGIETTF